MQSQEIGRDKFLIMSANLLHRALVEPSRADCKQLFKRLQKGEQVPLAAVEIKDAGHARFTLALENSEFRGTLNFSAFQSSLKALLGNIARTIEAKQDARVFNAQGDSGAMIFGITGVTFEGNQPNVLVLAAAPSPHSADTALQLMYLDPDQFTEDQTA